MPAGLGTPISSRAVGLIRAHSPQSRQSRTCSVGSGHCPWREGAHSGTDAQAGSGAEPCPRTAGDGCGCPSSSALCPPEAWSPCEPREHHPVPQRRAQLPLLPGRWQVLLRRRLAEARDQRLGLVVSQGCHLLAGSDVGDALEYNPNLLDDPQWPCGKHKRVLIFASYMVWRDLHWVSHLPLPGRGRCARHPRDTDST